MADTVTHEDMHELAKKIYREAGEAQNATETRAIIRIARTIENWALDLAQRENVEP